MRVVFFFTLIIIWGNIVANPYDLRPKKDNNSVLLSNSQNQFVSLLNLQKKRSKYIIWGLSADLHQTILNETSSKSFNPEVSFSIDAFLQFERFYYGLFLTFSDITAKKDITIDESTNTSIAKESNVEYSINLLKMGYSVIFKEHFRLIPFIHVGIGELYALNYNTGSINSDKKLFVNFTSGFGIKTHYIIYQSKKHKQHGIYYLPTTIGIKFDAGYNYQFTNIQIPLKGNLGYFSLGLFVGRSFVNQYKW